MSESIPASLCADDRSVQYGDGVFTTIRVDQLPHLLNQHLARLARDSEVLQLPFDVDACRRQVELFLIGRTQGVLKILHSRGRSRCGYAVPEPMQPQTVLYWSPLPVLHSEPLSLGFSPVVLSTQPLLAGVKHLNRLEQVLAHQRLPAGCNEALLLDAAGNVVEAIASNIFVIKHKQVWTPLLDRCGVAGIMREQVMQLLAERAQPVVQARLNRDAVLSAEAIFLSNCVRGIQQVGSIEGCVLTPHPLITELQRCINGG